jgi:hypothetical protein
MPKSAILKLRGLSPLTNYKYINKQNPIRQTNKQTNTFVQVTISDLHVVKRLYFVVLLNAFVLEIQPSSSHLLTTPCDHRLFRNTPRHRMTVIHSPRCPVAGLEVRQTAKTQPSVRGYNWATLFLGDINTGTWPSRLGSLRWDSEVWLRVLRDSDH